MTVSETSARRANKATILPDNRIECSTVIVVVSRERDQSLCRHGLKFRLTHNGLWLRQISRCIWDFLNECAGKNDLKVYACTEIATLLGLPGETMLIEPARIVLRTNDLSSATQPSCPPDRLKTIYTVSVPYRSTDAPL